jgi:hypothetical protein
MTEKDAAAQKRSEAAKKAAETRRKNAAAEEEDEKPEYEKESQEGDSPNADQQDGSDEKSDKAKGVKWNKQKRGISAGDVIDLECHRADVMPEDQQAQHEQRQRELLPIVQCTTLVPMATIPRTKSSTVRPIVPAGVVGSNPHVALYGPKGRPSCFRTPLPAS